MPRAKYQTNLPSIHLEEDNLSDLEDLLREGDTDPEIELKLHSGQFTYEYETTNNILSDKTLPDFIESYEFTSNSKEGKVKITADGENNEINLWISGEQEWVRRKQGQIEEFFDHRGDEIRTFLENRLALTTIGIAILGGAILIYTGAGARFGITEVGDLLLVGFGGLIISIILHSIINFLHPYTLIRLSTKRLHPYLWKLLRWATVLAALLTILTVGRQLTLT
jgi:hypothetical protein